MTVTLQNKIEAVDWTLDYLRKAGCESTDIFEAMKEIARELRAETPKEIGKTLRAMTDQVQRAQREKSHYGFFEYGTMRALSEALCGRWWPVIQRALQRHEAENVEASHS